MENIDQNKDVPTKEDSGLQAQIEKLQAQIALLTNKPAPVAPSNEGYANFEPKGETPIDERKQQIVGASIQTDIAQSTALINQYKEYFQTSKQEKIDDVFKIINAIPAQDQDLTFIRNDLNLLLCKVFFDYEGVEYEEYLLPKIEKIKSATKYTPAIKEEINDLLHHVPYVKKSIQQIVDRKKNAGLNFDGFSGSKRNVEYYISGYGQGSVTLKQLNEYLDGNPQEKQKYHEMIEEKSNAFLKERGYKKPSGMNIGLSNYSFGKPPTAQ